MLINRYAELTVASLYDGAIHNVTVYRPGGSNTYHNVTVGRIEALNRILNAHKPYMETAVLKDEYQHVTRYTWLNPQPLEILEVDPSA
jgi:hypothetical protein